MNIGVISDTHGLLRPEALTALRRVDHIVHAGDVGKPEILSQLGAIAPLTAVRGNIDQGAWAEALPLDINIPLASRRFYIVHNRADSRIDPAAADVIIFGHSHKPLIEKHGSTCYLNPGSAGPRRFRLPLTLAQIQIREDQLHIKLIFLLP